MIFFLVLLSSAFGWTAAVVSTIFLGHSFVEAVQTFYFASLSSMLAFVLTNLLVSVRRQSFGTDDSLN